MFETQTSLLAKTIAKALGKTTLGGYNAAPCSYFDGLYDYFNQNEQSYHAAWSGQKWNGPCVKINLFRLIFIIQQPYKDQSNNIVYYLLEAIKVIKLSFTMVIGMMWFLIMTQLKTLNKS